MITNQAVLVLTGHDDQTADAVIKELDRRGAPVVRMDTGDFPIRLSLSATIGPAGLDGRLSHGTATVDLSAVGSIYYRRPTAFTFAEELSDGDRSFAAAEARLGLGGVMAALGDVLWVNDPARVAVAEYKPLGLRTAVRAGLTVPQTLVTNDHAAAVRFAQTVGEGGLICKALSSLVLREGEQAKSVYTSRVTADQFDPDQIAATAHLLQAWVPKAYDARVTMVGERAHAVAIHASSDEGHVDWRTDYANLTYEPITAPGEVTAGMIAYLKALGLHYGAFDFVVTPDNRWVFLECNPAGQWLWLEHEAGLPIAASLAQLLATGEAA